MHNKETIHISFVHPGQVDALFMTSVLGLVRQYTQTIGSYNGLQGIGLLSRTRNMAVKHFLDETKDDWMLMVDSDQYIPPQSFKKLIDAADNWKTPVMSGLVFTVMAPDSETFSPVPCIYKRYDGILQTYYGYKRDSVEEIDSAGTGCLLVHRRVLEKMREDFQDETGADWAWFQDGPIEDNLWMGEDLIFCRRLIQSGFKIHVHTGAILPHHKPVWFSETHYARWVEDHNRKAGML